MALSTANHALPSLVAASKLELSENDTRKLRISPVLIQDATPSPGVAGPRIALMSVKRMQEWAATAISLQR
jgi:hypothetical protein